MSTARAAAQRVAACLGSSCWFAVGAGSVVAECGIILSVQQLLRRARAQQCGEACVCEQGITSFQQQLCASKTLTGHGCS